MPLPRVSPGQQIRATHVTSFTRWVAGETKDQSATFTTTHATEYTVTVTNEETGVGNALKIVSGASTIATFNKTGATFGVPISGTGALSGVALVSGQTAGDTFYASGTSALARVAKGTAFQGWVMNGGATGATWASCAVALAVTQGDLFVATGLNSLARLARGSTGQYLRADATGPIWETVTAAAAVEIITSTTLATAAAGVSFTSIPATYKHIAIHVQARSDGAVESTTLLMRLNGDSGSIYTWQRVIGQGTVAASAEAVAQSTIQVGLMPGATAATSAAVAAVINIPNYAGTVFRKVIDSTWSAVFTVTSAGMATGKNGGYYPSNSAISAIQIVPGSGNFVTGSTFTLYGFPT